MTIDLSSHAAYNRAVEYLETDAVEKAEKSNAVWGTYGPKGVVISESSNACHGLCKFVGASLVATVNMGTYSGGWKFRGSSGNYYNVPAIYNACLDTAVLTRWTDWLVNRSWARDYIAAPSTEFARDYGFVFSTDIPANFALAICTLGRHAGEHNHLVKRWFDLLERYPNMTEDTAYGIAFGVHTSDSPYGKPLTGHTSINHVANRDYLQNVSSQTIVNKLGPAISTSYRLGVTAMYGNSESGVAALLEDLAKGRVKADTVVIPNPFAPVVRDSRGPKQASEKLLHDVMPEFVNILQTRKEMKVAA